MRPSVHRSAREHIKGFLIQPCEYGLFITVGAESVGLNSGRIDHYPGAGLEEWKCGVPGDPQSLTTRQLRDCTSHSSSGDQQRICQAIKEINTRKKVINSLKMKIIVSDHNEEPQIPPMPFRGNSENQG